MRVIFLTITFEPEPGNFRGLPLARWLKARGYDIQVLTAVPQYPEGRVYPGYHMHLWQREVLDGVPVLRVPIYPSHDKSAMRRMATYLSFMLSAASIGAALIGPADLVYLYDPPPTNGLASLVLKLFRGTPIVHHIADMWPETVIASGMLRGKHLQGFATLALGKWCKFLYHHASVITVLSPGFKRLLVERGVPAKKVEVIYNWADEQSFCPVERDPAMARELGMDARFNIVYAGNMGPVQGLDNILAAARLIQDQPRIQIVLAGTGPSEPELRRQAREFGLRNVRFIGQREYAEMPRINALADALLVHLRDLPFLHATIPGKLQVSMASGRPILIAVGGDAADLVRDAGAGLVVEPENPGELARAMIAMSCMPKEQLEELGQRGRAYYLGHLSMGIAGQRMEEIFRKVVAGPYGGRKESTPTGQITAREKGDSGASGELPDSDTGPTVAEPISSRK